MILRDFISAINKNVLIKWLSVIFPLELLSIFTCNFCGCIGYIYISDMTLSNVYFSKDSLLEISFKTLHNFSQFIHLYIFS